LGEHRIQALICSQNMDGYLASSSSFPQNT